MTDPHAAEYIVSGGEELQPGPATNPRVLKGAFCIPTTPRVWWPAFLGVSDSEQDRYLKETLKRQYTFGQILVSGLPYANDYPRIEPDADVLWAGLGKCKAAGLTTIVAFDDSRGPDLSYLKPILEPCAPLIDWCMGVYECNGVFKDPNIVLDVLRQCRVLLPDAYLAVHFEPLDEGRESYGLVDWQRAKDEANLQALFFQCAGWQSGIQESINRIQDFTRRLGGPQFHHYPTLELGVVDYENLTSLVYRYQTSEENAVGFTDDIMNATLEPDAGVYAVPPSGWGDGGSA